MSAITPFSTFLAYQNILISSPLLYFRQEKNRLLTVARVLSAILSADNTGKFETLGSNFRHEIRFSEAAAVHCYSIRSLILFHL